MSRILGKERQPIARKDYPCNACPWIFNGDIGPEYYAADDELKIIAAARKARGRIRKGQKYMKQAVVGSDGKVFSFRAIPEMHEICLKYGLYEEE